MAAAKTQKAMNERIAAARGPLAIGPGAMGADEETGAKIIKVLSRFASKENILHFLTIIYVS